MDIKTAHLFAGIEGFRYGLERANDIAHQQIEKRNPSLRGGSIEKRCQSQLSSFKSYREQYQSDIKRGSDRFFIESQEPSEPKIGRYHFVSVYSNDFDKYASAITRYNYPDGTHYEGDIRAVNAESIPDCDLITFGWPCQDNSIAGKRAGQKQGTRSGLLFEAVRILRAKKPRYFIAENVPGLFSVTEGEDFYEAIRLFTDSGYDCQWQVLNTRWFLPQNRERIIFVGHLRGTRRPQVFPIGEASQAHSKSNGEAVDNCLDSNYHKGWLDHGQRTMIYQTGRYDRQFEGLEQSLQTNHFNVPIVQRQPLKFLGRNQRNIEGDYAFTVDGSGTNGVSICTARTVRSSGQASPFNSKQNWDTYLIGNQIRRLTPIECERLQGFPDNWTKYGIDKNGNKIAISDTQRYKCCGNAVSTPVITEVGLRLLAEDAK